jgi:hypothetical protein
MTREWLTARMPKFRLSIGTKLLLVIFTRDAVFMGLCYFFASIVGDLGFIDRRSLYLRSRVNPVSRVSQSLALRPVTEVCEVAVQTF